MGFETLMNVYIFSEIIPYCEIKKYTGKVTTVAYIGPKPATP